MLPYAAANGSIACMFLALAVCLQYPGGMARTIHVPATSAPLHGIGSKGIDDATRSRMDLRRAKAVLAASPAELGQIFRVTRQAVEAWKTNVPALRRADVARVADVANRLARTFRSERIPQIARSPIPILAGKTIMATLAEADGAARVLESLDRLASYVPAP